MSDLDGLYKDIILEHHKDPRNFGHLEHCDCKIEKFNPLCGDRITLELKLDAAKEKIEDIRFEGEGCSISQASASIMTEEVKGLKKSEALARVEDFRKLLQGEPTAVIDGDLEALSGVKHFPVRIKCAFLAWNALSEVLSS